MKKRIIAILAFLIIAIVPVKAQVFITDEDQFEASRIGSSSFDADLPGYYDSGADWYTPTGSGVLLLTGLACSYLLFNKKKRK